MGGAGNALTWFYSAADRSFYGFHNHTGGTTATDEFFLVPACPSNVPTADDPWGGDAFCGPAGTGCPQGILVWVYSRPKGATTVAPVKTGMDCLVPSNIVALDQLVGRVTGDLQQWLASRHFDRPTLTVDPPSRPLVDLPTVFATDPVTATTLDITDPFAAEVAIEPHVTWSFGDGAGTAAPDDPGRAFDGTDPRTDPGHYPVRHVYREPGEHVAGVTVRWQATRLTVPGIGDFPVDAAVTVTSAPHVLTVHSAHAVLTGS